MTVGEQHAEIGRQYMRRQEIKRQLACMDSKLNRMRDKLTNAASAIQDRMQESKGIDNDLPTCNEIMRLMSAEAQLQSELQELDNFFERLG